MILAQCTCMAGVGTVLYVDLLSCRPSAKPGGMQAIGVMYDYYL